MVVSLVRPPLFLALHFFDIFILDDYGASLDSMTGCGPVTGGLIGGF